MKKNEAKRAREARLIQKLSYPDAYVFKKGGNMKKKIVVTFCLFVVFSIAGFSFEAGTKSLGGNISLSNSKFSDELSASTNFTISPAISYFIVDHISLDLAPVFGINWGKDYETSLGVGIDLGARYFFKNFYGGFGFIYSKSGPKGRKYSAKYLDLKLGYLVGIAKNVYFDMGIIYHRGLGKTTSWLLPPGGNYIQVSSDNDLALIRARLGVSLFFK
jgi:hypothetical protein